MSEPAFVHSPASDPEGLTAIELVMHDDALFFATSSFSPGIMAWEPLSGTRAFRRWIGDPSKGAGNLGTDGIDLVWSYGEGKPPNSNEHPIRSIMTAPEPPD
jgi:hypothetical protein